VTVPDQQPRAAPLVRLEAGQRRAGHPVDPTLPRAQVDHIDGSLHGARAGSVQGFLERLTRPSRYAHLPRNDSAESAGAIIKPRGPRGERLPGPDFWKGGPKILPPPVVAGALTAAVWRGAHSDCQRVGCVAYPRCLPTRRCTRASRCRPRWSRAAGGEPGGVAGAGVVRWLS